MSSIIKQEEYYSISAISARLSEALGSDEWTSIKATDLGQALIAWASNVVYMDAQAFFLGLNQMLKSTVTQQGYLEEIAKSRGVIPKTYISANLTVILRSATNSKTYLPLDFCIEVGGKKFYNITDITIPNTPTTIILYEGSAIREASQAGTPSFNLWSYTKFKAPQSEKVGDKIVRRYILLPRETFTDSIVVETGSSFVLSFVRWTETDSWYGVSQTSRVWKLRKDFLGRYIVEFGDGVYGREFPVDDIVGIRYLVSGGSGITITDFSSYKLRYQDVQDITSTFIVTSVSNLVDGSSEINMADLHLEIERKENTRESLVRKQDYINYLEGRSDVLSASVKAERDEDPPNIEYFNTVTYAIKANTEAGNFNDAEIQAEFARIGLDTVEFKNIVAKRNKFNVNVEFSPLTGYVAATVQNDIQGILDSAFAWENLGFEEIISESRVYNLIKDVEGLDLDSLVVTVEAVYTDESSGVTEFDWVDGNIINLKFYPKRFRLFVDSDILNIGTVARDNGLGSLYGDVAGVEKFDFANTNPSACSMLFGNLLMIGAGDSATLNLIDLRKDVGAVSKITFKATVNAITWCDKYNEIITLEDSTGYKLRAYSFPSSFFDADSFSYIQIQDVYTYADYTHTLSLTPPSGFTIIQAIQYFDNYIYVIWQEAGGATSLFRYRITQSGIEAFDATYEIALDTTKVYANMAVAEGVYSTAKNVLYLCAALVGTESGIDAIIDFDITDDATFEKNFLGTSIAAVYTGINWKGISTDGTNIYGALTSTETTTTIILKMYSITEAGACNLKALSNTSMTEMTCALYDIYASVQKVYFYNADDFKFYYVGSNATAEAPTERAGTTTGDVASITKLATIHYDMLTCEFDETVTNATLRYEAETNLEYQNEELAIVNDVTVTNI